MKYAVLYWGLSGTTTKSHMANLEAGDCLFTQDLYIEVTTAPEIQYLACMRGERVLFHLLHCLAFGSGRVPRISQGLLARSDISFNVFQP